MRNRNRIHVRFSFSAEKYLFSGKSVEELEKLQQGIEAKLKDRSEGAKGYLKWQLLFKDTIPK